LLAVSKSVSPDLPDSSGKRAANELIGCSCNLTRSQSRGKIRRQSGNGGHSILEREHRPGCPEVGRLWTPVTTCWVAPARLDIEGDHSSGPRPCCAGLGGGGSGAAERTPPTARPVRLIRGSRRHVSRLASSMLKWPPIGKKGARTSEQPGAVRPPEPPPVSRPVGAELLSDCALFGEIEHHSAESPRAGLWLPGLRAVSSRTLSGRKETA
jgi:hypothetical protein